ncbi:hypothetical protein VM98_33200 [Streptomyces rubellomurinus subsp. indigoferus]|nr:hypothetical protein VM98_33200 [Streptomyces rubellomurinus subsp. indigoferus]
MGWSGDGTVAAVAAAKRADAAVRLELTREGLGGRRVLADRCSYFAWWRLAPRWRDGAVVAGAGRAVVPVPQGGGCGADAGRSAHAVRIGVASPPVAVVAQGLGTLEPVAAAGAEAGAGGEQGGGGARTEASGSGKGAGAGIGEQITGDR